MTEPIESAELILARLDQESCADEAQSARASNLDVFVSDDVDDVQSEGKNSQASPATEDEHLCGPVEEPRAAPHMFPEEEDTELEEDLNSHWKLAEQKERQSLVHVHVPSDFESNGRNCLFDFDALDALEESCLR